MAAYLKTQEATLDFKLQLRTSERMPIEDPTVEWDEHDSPFVTVGTISIPPQVCDSVERIDLGERLTFTPWRCLPEHLPLGSINRVRRVVYESISTLRRQLNDNEKLP